MEGVESQPCVFLGIKVKPGPIERYKLENFTLENTVELLRNEAEKKANIPSASLELLHHGKILKDNTTLVDSGVKSGEMVHVVKKKVQPPPAPPTTYTDAELQMLNNSLRTLGCTPNAVGWTRAMQLLNDESAMAEIIEHAPSLAEDCMTLSILHEVELLAALGANLQTMRRGAEAHPDLPNALRHLMRLVGLRANFPVPTPDPAPTSGFAYSLEALSEDEDAEEEEAEEGEGRSAITQEQLAAALQAATEAVLSSNSRGAGGAGGSGGGAQGRLLALLQAAADSEAAPASPSGAATPSPAAARTPAASGAGGAGGAITAEMFSSAISSALSRAQAADAPVAQSAASSSQSPAPRDDDFSAQLQRMHEMGLLDDALNVRALLICAGDVNAAINLVFSGAIGDD